MWQAARPQNKNDNDDVNDDNADYHYNNEYNNAADDYAVYVRKHFQRFSWTYARMALFALNALCSLVQLPRPATANLA